MMISHKTFIKVISANLLTKVKATLAKAFAPSFATALA